MKEKVEMLCKEIEEKIEECDRLKQSQMDLLEKISILWYGRRQKCNFICSGGFCNESKWCITSKS